MDPYEWTLVKLPSGKSKAIIIEESTKYKDWRANETNLVITKQVMAKRQAIVDSFEIYNGYPKVLREYGIYTNEQYINKREEENEILRVKGKDPLKIIP
jgi:hypothetical protein